MIARAVRLPVAPGLAWGRSLHWHHPQWWVAATAAMAWLVLFVGQGMGGPHGADGHGHGLAAEIAAFPVMTVAMMVPLVLPALGQVAHCSLWQRRHRAMVLFLAGYLGVWAVVGVALALVRAALSWSVGDLAFLVAAFALATGWQLAPQCERRLRRCERTEPLRARGRDADLDCLRFGAGAGSRCVATCWALMAASVSAHSLATMLVLFGVQLGDRRARRPAALLGAMIIGGLGLGITLSRIVS